MNLKEIEQAVIAEIETIKLKATPEEIAKLDYDSLVPTSPSSCIYGQMTGSCRSDRAIEIQAKILDTFLEVWLISPISNNENIIDYLKGNTDILQIKK